MNLKREQIPKLATFILRELKNKSLLEFKSPEAKVLAKIEEVIRSEFGTEDKLNDDARKLLETYREQIRSGMMDEHQVFNMIRKQLAKERKIVL